MTDKDIVEMTIQAAHAGIRKAAKIILADGALLILNAYMVVLNYNSFIREGEFFHKLFVFINGACCLLLAKLIFKRVKIINGISEAVKILEAKARQMKRLS